MFQGAPLIFRMYVSQIIRDLLNQIATEETEARDHESESEIESETVWSNVTSNLTSMQPV